MLIRPLSWIDRIGVFDPAVAAEHKRRVARLRAQIEDIQKTIDSSCQCMNEASEMIAQIDRIIEKDDFLRRSDIKRSLCARA